MNILYDRIGLDCATLHHPDHRIAVRTKGALGAARTAPNLGAGAGGDVVFLGLGRRVGRVGAVGGGFGERRYADLLALEVPDYGYRLVETV